MDALAPETRVARREGLIAETLGEETVMLDPERDTYLRLNRTGGIIWSGLDEPATVGELAERLARAAGIEAGRAREDTLRFVSQMVDHGAIRVLSPEGR
jgi:hypothetical protein